MKSKIFYNSKLFHRKLRGLALRVFNWIENNNNVDFSSNGEEYFIDALTRHYADKPDKHKQLELFDVGANKGDYTQILLDKLSKQGSNARINIFEPTKSCFRLLANRFASSTNVILNQAAVSDASSSIQIYYDQKESVLASLYQRNLSSFGISLNQSEIVKTVRLDTYIKDNQIAHIHFMKVDIEGHEVAAFGGMGEYLSGDFVDFIQFEYGGANLDSKTSLMELYALFESRGFVVGKLMPRGIELRAYQPWMENFQYANYVAVSRQIAEKLQP